MPRGGADLTEVLEQTMQTQAGCRGPVWGCITRESGLGRGGGAAHAREAVCKSDGWAWDRTHRQKGAGSRERQRVGARAGSGFLRASLRFVLWTIGEIVKTWVTGAQEHDVHAEIEGPGGTCKQVDDCVTKCEWRAQEDHAKIKRKCCEVSYGTKKKSPRSD